MSKPEIVLTISCGCSVAKNGNEYALGMCPLHAGAPKLLGEAKYLLGLLACQGRRELREDIPLMQSCERLEFAITEADA